MALYLKRTVARDTPEDIAARAAYLAAHVQARTEFDAMYQQITAETVAEAAEFQARRIQEILANLSA